MVILLHSGEYLRLQKNQHETQTSPAIARRARSFAGFEHLSGEIGDNPGLYRVIAEQDKAVPKPAWAAGKPHLHFNRFCAAPGHRDREIVGGNAAATRRAAVEPNRAVGVVTESNRKLPLPANFAVPDRADNRLDGY
jgi:hypothetical protein